jgi:hypothetical protein
MPSGWLRRRRDDRDRITVTGSGAATAHGGYANSGVHIGDVNLLTGTPVRTHYRHQVQRIAPPDLEDRHEELAELATFCTSPATAGTYAWWRAEAWSGKTGLMSWFVLHPPAGVRLVSFFVTGRFAAQNDRHAFIDNLTEQLLALLGRHWPPDPGRSRHETNMLGLLTEAAETCAGRGEPFVLLVDGLDEDRGVHAGPDSHSIAGLLPATLPAGMRVIVTGRPHPPVPADVPPHHPLRDDAIVRTLAPSPRAQAVRVEMERDLKRLLDGTGAELDLLGLVTAAGGGLSAADLAELTGNSRWQVDDHLRSVTGRSFAVRDSHIQAGGPDVYLLGHEEIQRTALDVLGPDRLDDYRGRLHAWAERCRAAGWPPDTAEYLLSGYFGMLTATRDTTRMVACAIDRHRQDRTLDLSGGDAVSLTEINTAHDVIAAREHPDLCALVRLAIHRDHLVNRNSNVPAALPAVWARVGNADRAESIANSITSPSKHIAALSAVAVVASTSGDRRRTARLVDDAEQVAHTVIDPDLHAHALMRVVGMAAETGDFDRAEHLAQTITDHPASHMVALARIAGAAAKAGDLARAQHIAQAIPVTDSHALAQVAVARAEAGDYDGAEQIAGTIQHPYYRADALAQVAGAVAETGDLDRAERIAHTIVAHRPYPSAHALALARVAGAAAAAGGSTRAARLLGRATQSARDVREPGSRERVLEWVAYALVKVGDVDEAEQIVHTIPYPDRTRALARLAEAVARAGDVARAEHIAYAITRHDPSRKAEALALVAGVVAEAGESEHVTRLLDDAERIARTVDIGLAHAQAQARVTGVVAEAGHLDRAEQLAQAITSSHWQAQAQERIAGAAADAGELDRAERIARTITDKERYWKPEALARVAQALARGGEFDRAEDIAGTVDYDDSPVNMLARVAVAVAKAGDVDRAERIADAGPSRWKGEALTHVAEAVGRAGDLDRAEHIARGITDGYWLGKALARVSGAIAQAGEPERAAGVLDDAERIARAIKNPRNRVNVLVWVAEAAAGAGRSGHAVQLLDDAERIVGTINFPDSQATALAWVAGAVAKAGDFDRAGRLAHTITLDLSHRARALMALARNRSAPCRERWVADVLRLDDWPLAIEVLAELVPESPDVILAELAAVGQATTG